MTITILGCKVEITFPFVALLCTMVILQSPYTVLWGFFSIVVHELGHIIYMINSNTPPDKIKLTAFSIDIVDNYSFSRSQSDTILLAVSGPFANFCVSGIIFVISKLFHITSLNVPLWGNFFLGCFNLLPIVSLDGYKIISTLLSKHLTLPTTSIIMHFISIITLIPILIIGFTLLLQSRCNFSLISVSVYLVCILIFSYTDLI